MTWQNLLANHLEPIYFCSYRHNTIFILVYSTNALWWQTQSKLGNQCCWKSKELVFFFQSRFVQLLSGQPHTPQAAPGRTVYHMVLTSASHGPPRLPTAQVSPLLPCIHVLTSSLAPQLCALPVHQTMCFTGTIGYAASFCPALSLGAVARSQRREGEPRGPGCCRSPWIHKLTPYGPHKDSGLPTGKFQSMSKSEE